MKDPGLPFERGDVDVMENIESHIVPAHWKEIRTR